MMHRVATLAVVSCLLLAGCKPTLDEEADPHALVTETTDEDALRAELDEVLRFTLEERQLSLEKHAAWQILHGALAYQREFPVADAEGKEVSAVDHLLNGGGMRGWTVEVIDHEATGEKGLRAILEQGSRTGQGHADQWFAVLAQCGLPQDQVIRVGSQSVTMSDFVTQVMADIPMNLEREYSWTLIGLTSYLPTDYQWEVDGDEWSIQRLVQIESEHELAVSACGGSHRLIGLTMALNQHLQQKGPVEGPWKAAESRIQAAIQRAREYQNPDGTFSTNYFARPGRSADLAENLGATGHTLEFLVLAMSDDQLQAPWVKRSVLRLCEIFRNTRGVPLECGALYHAAHGLALYRTRVYSDSD